MTISDIITEMTSERGQITIERAGAGWAASYSLDGEEARVTDPSDFGYHGMDVSGLGVDPEAALANLYRNWEHGMSGPKELTP